jgi:hypothetical protein
MDVSQLITAISLQSSYAHLTVAYESMYLAQAEKCVCHTSAAMQVKTSKCRRNLTLSLHPHKKCNILHLHDTKLTTKLFHGMVIPI